MPYWLMKSEPDAYSWDDLCREGIGTWDGVRNYLARNHIRAMKQGDKVLFYHSNIGLEVVGLMELVEEAFQDPTTDDQRWSAVRVKPLQAFPKPVKLSEIKLHPLLQNVGLIRQSRLSVMPLTDEEFAVLLDLGGL
jgi:predicted RNA-binding protein with PUA-like domain